MKIIRCPNCGQTYSPKSAIYCAKCGELLPEQASEKMPAPGNGWVRFLGGLCVFMGIAALIIFSAWSYQTYKDVTITDTPNTGQPSGLIVLGRSDQHQKSQEALFILAAGFILALVLEALGEGLILMAQVREEQFDLLEKLENLKLGT